MVRYKRRFKRYRRSTNTIMMKFQSFMDISTKADGMQIITISAGGKNILERLPAQFAAYKYYKIGNIAVKLVPASTLPVDPTGLSLEAGENTVDPRDQLTPGMMRITNGEDVFENISGLSVENQHKLYNSMLLDPRWFKWMLQSGVKRHATPRYWQIGQLHQDKWPGSVINAPHVTRDSADDPYYADDTSYKSIYASGSGDAINNNLAGLWDNNASSAYGIFQTGHKGVLGWMPTDSYQRFCTPDGLKSQDFLVSPPEVEVMKIILPPAHNTRYYYRMFITETVYFKEPLMQALNTADFPYRPLDVFHSIVAPVPVAPIDPAGATNIPEEDTGGNYGDD